MALLTRRLATLVALATLAAAGLVGGTLATPAPASACTLGVGGSGDHTSTHLPTRQRYTPVPWAAPSIPSDTSQTQGRDALTAALDATGCRSVVGYSAGAKVAGDLCDARPAVRCELIADPRRPGGIEDNYPSPLPGWTMTGPRQPRPNVTQVCIPHDWVCDAPAILDDPAGAADALVGAFTGRHQDYYRR